MIILGLDMSSTCIGHAALEDGAPYAWGAQDLSGTIAARAAAAAQLVGWLLDHHQPALVVIESPVARFAKAVIPQARVSGAVLALLHQRQALWAEVTPTQAKTALCGDGAASKHQMVEAAAERLGLAGRAEVKRGKAVYADVVGVALTEDEADALGVALAGLRIRVVTKETA